MRWRGALLIYEPVISTVFGTATQLSSYPGPTVVTTYTGPPQTITQTPAASTVTITYTGTAQTVTFTPPASLQTVTPTTNGATGMSLLPWGIRSALTHNSHFHDGRLNFDIYERDGRELLHCDHVRPSSDLDVYTCSFDPSRYSDSTSVYPNHHADDQRASRDPDVYAGGFDRNADKCASGDLLHCHHFDWRYHIDRNSSSFYADCTCYCDGNWNHFAADYHDNYHDRSAEMS